VVRKYINQQLCKKQAVQVHDHNMKGVKITWLSMVEKAVLDCRSSPSGSRHLTVKQLCYKESVNC
jgi:hypothetical protein